MARLSRSVLAACAAVVLAAGFARASSLSEIESTYDPNAPEDKINEVNLLLPYRASGPGITSLLYFSKGCFEWESRDASVATVTPVPARPGGVEPECPPGFSRVALVTATVSGDGEEGKLMRETTVEAARLSGGVRRVGVIVAPIASLEVATTTRSITVGTRERVGLLARDAAGNTFSTLEGLHFAWTTENLDVEERGETARVLLEGAPTPHVPRTPPLLTVGRLGMHSRISEARARVESGGLYLSDSVILQGREPGRAILRASLAEPGLAAPATPSQVVTVYDAAWIEPRGPLLAPPCTDLALRLVLASEETGDGLSANGSLARARLALLWDATTGEPTTAWRAHVAGADLPPGARFVTLPSPPHWFTSRDASVALPVDHRGGRALVTNASAAETVARGPAALPAMDLRLPNFARPPQVKVSRATPDDLAVSVSPVGAAAGADRRRATKNLARAAAAWAHGLGAPASEAASTGEAVAAAARALAWMEGVAGPAWGAASARTGAGDAAFPFRLVRGVPLALAPRLLGESRSGQRTAMTLGTNGGFAFRLVSKAGERQRVRMTGFLPAAEARRLGRGEAPPAAGELCAAVAAGNLELADEAEGPTVALVSCDAPGAELAVETAFRGMTSQLVDKTGGNNPLVVASASAVASDDPAGPVETPAGWTGLSWAPASSLVRVESFLVEEAVAVTAPGDVGEDLHILIPAGTLRPEQVPFSATGGSGAFLLRLRRPLALEHAPASPPLSPPLSPPVPPPVSAVSHRNGSAWPVPWGLAGAGPTGTRFVPPLRDDEDATGDVAVPSVGAGSGGGLVSLPLPLPRPTTPLLAASPAAPGSLATVQSLRTGAGEGLVEWRGAVGAVATEVSDARDTWNAAGVVVEAAVPTSLELLPPPTIQVATGQSLALLALARDAAGRYFDQCLSLGEELRWSLRAGEAGSAEDPRNGTAVASLDEVRALGVAASNGSVPGHAPGLAPGTVPPSLRALGVTAIPGGVCGAQTLRALRVGVATLSVVRPLPPGSRDTPLRAQARILVFPSLRVLFPPPWALRPAVRKPQSQQRSQQQSQERGEQRGEQKGGGEGVVSSQLPRLELRLVVATSSWVLLHGGPSSPAAGQPEAQLRLREEEDGVGVPPPAVHLVSNGPALPSLPAASDAGRVYPWPAGHHLALDLPGAAGVRAGPYHLLHVSCPARGSRSLLLHIPRDGDDPAVGSPGAALRLDVECLAPAHGGGPDLLPADLEAPEWALANATTLATAAAAPAGSAETLVVARGRQLALLAGSGGAAGEAHGDAAWVRVSNGSHALGVQATSREDALVRVGGALWHLEALEGTLAPASSSHRDHHHHHHHRGRVGAGVHSVVPRVVPLPLAPGHVDASSGGSRDASLALLSAISAVAEAQDLFMPGLGQHAAASSLWQSSALPQGSVSHQSAPLDAAALLEASPLLASLLLTAVAEPAPAVLPSPPCGPQRELCPGAGLATSAASTWVAPASVSTAGPLRRRLLAGDVAALLSVPADAPLGEYNVSLQWPDDAPAPRPLRLRVVEGAVLRPQGLVLQYLHGSNVLRASCRGGSRDVRITGLSGDDERLPALPLPERAPGAWTSFVAGLPPSLPGVLLAADGEPERAALVPLRAGDLGLECEDEGAERGVAGRDARRFRTHARVRVAQAAAAQLSTPSSMVVEGRLLPLDVLVTDAAGSPFPASQLPYMHPRVDTDPPSRIRVESLPVDAGTSDPAGAVPPLPFTTPSSSAAAATGAAAASAASSRPATSSSSGLGVSAGLAFAAPPGEQDGVGLTASPDPARAGPLAERRSLFLRGLSPGVARVTLTVCVEGPLPGQANPGVCRRVASNTVTITVLSPPAVLPRALGLVPLAAGTLQITGATGAASSAAAAAETIAVSRKAPALLPPALAAPAEPAFAAGPRLVEAFASRNESVVKVDASGFYAAVGAGETTVHVLLVDPDATPGSAAATVFEAEVPVRVAWPQAVEVASSVPNDAVVGAQLRAHVQGRDGHGALSFQEAPVRAVWTLAERLPHGGSGGGGGGVEGEEEVAPATSPLSRDGRPAAAAEEARELARLRAARLAALDAGAPDARRVAALVAGYARIPPPPNGAAAAAAATSPATNGSVRAAVLGSVVSPAALAALGESPAVDEWVGRVWAATQAAWQGRGATMGELALAHSRASALAAVEFPREEPLTLPLRGSRPGEASVRVSLHGFSPLQPLAPLRAEAVVRVRPPFRLLSPAPVDALCAEGVTAALEGAARGAVALLRAGRDGASRADALDAVLQSSIPAAAGAAMHSGVCRGRLPLLPGSRFRLRTSGSDAVRWWSEAAPQALPAIEGGIAADGSFSTAAAPGRVSLLRAHDPATGEWLEVVAETREVAGVLVRGPAALEPGASVWASVVLTDAGGGRVIAGNLTGAAGHHHHGGSAHGGAQDGGASSGSALLGGPGRCGRQEEAAAGSPDRCRGWEPLVAAVEKREGSKPLGVSPLPTAPRPAPRLAAPWLPALQAMSSDPAVLEARLVPDVGAAGGFRLRLRARQPGAALVRVWLPLAAHAAGWDTAHGAPSPSSLTSGAGTAPFGARSAADTVRGLRQPFREIMGEDDLAVLEARPEARAGMGDWLAVRVGPPLHPAGPLVLAVGGTVQFTASPALATRLDRVAALGLHPWSCRRSDLRSDAATDRTGGALVSATARCQGLDISPAGRATALAPGRYHLDTRPSQSQSASSASADDDAGGGASVLVRVVDLAAPQGEWAARGGMSVLSDARTEPGAELTSHEFPLWLRLRGEGDIELPVRKPALAPTAPTPSSTDLAALLHTSLGPDTLPARASSLAAQGDAALALPHPVAHRVLFVCGADPEVWAERVSVAAVGLGAAAPVADFSADMVEELAHEGGASSGPEATPPAPSTVSSSSSSSSSSWSSWSTAGASAGVGSLPGSGGDDDGNATVWSDSAQGASLRGIAQTVLSVPPGCLVSPQDAPRPPQGSAFFRRSVRLPPPPPSDLAVSVVAVPYSPAAARLVGEALSAPRSSSQRAAAQANWDRLQAMASLPGAVRTTFARTFTPALLLSAEGGLGALSTANGTAVRLAHPGDTARFVLWGDTDVAITVTPRGAVSVNMEDPLPAPASSPLHHSTGRLTLTRPKETTVPAETATVVLKHRVTGQTETIPIVLRAPSVTDRLSDALAGEDTDAEPATTSTGFWATLALLVLTPLALYFIGPCLSPQAPEDEGF